MLAHLNNSPQVLCTLYTDSEPTQGVEPIWLETNKMAEKNS